MITILQISDSLFFIRFDIFSLFKLFDNKFKKKKTNTYQIITFFLSFFSLKYIDNKNRRHEILNQTGEDKKIL
jgi:hypothetical protein